MPRLVLCPDGSDVRSLVSRALRIGRGAAVLLFVGLFALARSASLGTAARWRSPLSSASSCPDLP